MAAGRKPIGLPISSSLEDALMKPCDVVVDYTKPNVVKQHALATIGKGVAFVVGTSGLSAQDYAEIDSAAKAKGVGVFAAGNYSITATLLAKFAVDGGEIRRRRRGHRLCGRRQARRALGHRARARRAALRGAPALDLEAGRRAHRPEGDARRDHRRGAGAFRAHAGLRALLRGRVRRARRAPCSSATTPAPRPSLMWRGRCSPSGACATRSASGAASIS